MKLIVAVNNKNFIGKGGEMMWRSKEDFLHFKKMTVGKFNTPGETSGYMNNLIVGRTTFEKDLKGRSLPNRNTMVVGRVKGPFYSLQEAVRDALVAERDFGNVTWVIGGSQIYSALVHLCTEIHISHINDNQIGDTKFIIPANYRGKVFHYNFQPDAQTPLTYEQRLDVAVSMGLMTKTIGDPLHNTRDCYFLNPDKVFEASVTSVEEYMDHFKVPRFEK